MPMKRSKRQGRLLQKRKIDSNIEESDNFFRVMGVDRKGNITIIKDCRVFEEAKRIVDLLPQSSVDYYIHYNESSRVLYSRMAENNGEL